MRWATLTDENLSPRKFNQRKIVTTKIQPTKNFDHEIRTFTVSHSVPHSDLLPPLQIFADFGQNFAPDYITETYVSLHLKQSM